MQRKFQALSENGTKAWYVWPIKILIVTLVLSFGISIISESTLQGTSFILSVALLIPLLVCAIVADVVGVSVAACNPRAFEKKDRENLQSFKMAKRLVQNAEKISCICNDVVGDVCGIISGAIGSNMAMIIIGRGGVVGASALIAAGVSAVIAGITVFGKALAKKYAIDNAEKITLIIAKILSVFSKKIK